jgi:hypothetical protein
MSNAWPDGLRVKTRTRKMFWLAVSRSGSSSRPGASGGVVVAVQVRGSALREQRQPLPLSAPQLCNMSARAQAQAPSSRARDRPSKQQVKGLGQHTCKHPSTNQKPQPSALQPETRIRNTFNPKLNRQTRAYDRWAQGGRVRRVHVVCGRLLAHRVLRVEPRLRHHHPLAALAVEPRSPPAEGRRRHDVRIARGDACPRHHWRVLPSHLCRTSPPAQRRHTQALACTDLDTNARTTLEHRLSRGSSSWPASRTQAQTPTCKVQHIRQRRGALALSLDASALLPRAHQWHVVAEEGDLQLPRQLASAHRPRETRPSGFRDFRLGPKHREAPAAPV